MTNIGENIQKYREIRGLSSKELGKLIDVPRFQIEKYESNQVVPTLKMLNRLLIALDVSYDDLVDFNDNVGNEPRNDNDYVDKLVKRDNAIEPIKVKSKNATYLACPVCNNWIYTGKPKFCPNCGQRLYWNNIH